MTEIPENDTPEAPRRRRPPLPGRDLVVQLAVVVAGVLIALTFEGLREWRNDRALVAEARRNIARELRDNKIEIDGMPKGYAIFKTQVDAAAAAAEALLEGRPGPNSLELKFVFAELGTASRSTAELTAAFGLMSYEEVRKYEAVYGLQQTFTETERQCYQTFLTVISSVRLAADPARAAPAELAEWERQIHLLRSTVGVLEVLVERLSSAYEAALDGR